MEKNPRPVFLPIVSVRPGLNVLIIAAQFYPAARYISPTFSVRFLFLCATGSPGIHCRAQESTPGSGSSDFRSTETAPAPDCSAQPAGCQETIRSYFGHSFQ